jgi:serine/threonine protein kinase
MSERDSEGFEETLPLESNSDPGKTAAFSPLGPPNETDKNAWPLAVTIEGGSTPPPGNAEDVRARDFHGSSRYSRIRAHAKGGLGLVYLAQDHELQREVALKEIQPEFLNNHESSARFLLEAQLTGRLEHPGIVPVYGLGKYPDGRPYYAMRFIQGESFQEEIESFHRKHPLSQSSLFDSRDFRGLISRFVDVCNAIHYAHEKGVLHRDIKPANVMLGKYGETLVVDWGLAKILPLGARPGASEQVNSRKNLDSPSSTQDGDVMGTPLYMSPEQAAGRSAEMTETSDVYSLGAMLVTLATGQKPIDGRTRYEVLENVRTGRIRYVRDMVPRAPRALDAICRRAMALEPVNRYPTARALAEDLERWMADEAVDALKGKESWVELSGRLMRRYRNWTLSIGAALLLITLMSILAAFIVNDARRKELLAKNEAREYRQDALGRYRMSRDAIDSWLVDSSEALTYFPATQSIRKELLARAAEDYATLS